MAYVRCSYCNARRTLAKPVDHYYRPPPCRTCGRKKYRTDKWRAKHERGIAPCMCHKRALGGSMVYWFPHRKGSLYCADNPKLTTEMLQEWARDRGLT